MLTWVGCGLWSGAFSVDAGDEFAVDLAGGGDFLLALCEFFFRLGQGLVELFDAGIGRVGDRGVAEVCEYLAAEDLAEAARRAWEFGVLAVVGGSGVRQIGAERRGGGLGAGGGSARPAGRRSLAMTET